MEKKEKDVKDIAGDGQEKEACPEENRRDNRNLLIAVGIVAAVFIIFIMIIMFYRPEEGVMTIDDLHDANLEGELDPSEGYMYDGFSFVRFGDLWYSQLQKGGTVYDVTFNYDPRSVEDIPVEGVLTRGFVEGKRLYVTFDPTGDFLKYVAVANFGLSRSLAWAFGYDLTAGCTKNVTKACENAGVVLCGDPGKSVIHLKEAAEAKVILNSTCVTVQGAGPDIVRAKDRLLLRWYGMMD